MKTTISEDNVFKTVHNIGIRLSSGSGCRFKDQEGKEYLDLFGQANTLHAGYNNRAVLDPIRERLKDWVNTTPYMLNQEQLDAAALMAEILPGDLNYTSFYSNGSDAVETAIKLAFRATGRRKVISHWGGYHGWSAYALAAGGAPFYRQSFEPLIPGFIHIPPPYLREKTDADDYICYLKDAFTYEGKDSIAAVLVEPIVSGGLVIPPPAYLQTMRELCDEAGAILIFDEVITGFGKTGKMFAFQHFDVEPDIVAMGKAISSSAIPAAAITINDRVMDMVGLPKSGFENVFLASEQHSGQHVITNQNHPLICVAIKSNIEYILEHNLVERSKELGAYLLKKLQKFESRFKQLKRARGKGLQAGIEVTDSEDPWKGDEQLAAKICNEMFKKGFIIYSTFNRVRGMALVGFTPPLVITREDIDIAMDAFEKTLGELIK